MESPSYLDADELALSEDHMESNYTPISPEDDVTDPLHERSQPPSGTLGQLSFAPTTKTTVVTTTTTTTTAFPPFCIKAPRHLKDRDPELYPLASSPTPHSIKRLKFDIGGVSARFDESENIDQRLHLYGRQQELLRKHNGSIQTVTHSDTGSRHAPITRFGPMHGKPQNETAHPHSRPLSATPISAPDAKELQSFHRRNKQPAKVPSLVKHPKNSLRGSAEAPDIAYKESNAISPESSDEESEIISSVQPASRRRKSQQQTVPIQPDRRTAEVNKPVVGSVTPPITDADMNTSGCPRSRLENRRPTPFPAIDTSPIQDGSLPSPSLSPITAAANIYRSNTTPRSQQGIIPVPENNRPSFSTRKVSRISKSSGSVDEDEGPSVGADAPPPVPSLPDLPVMLDTFDSMPDSLQAYAMYQLLRRCSKSTIRLVSESVDPALRCDYLKRLPLELSLQILQYLDFKSLCRGAQVSKKWRRIIDSDERRWRDLITEDGYNLPSGEMGRAIREGWGWQMLSSDGEPFADLAAHESPSSLDGGETTITRSELGSLSIEASSALANIFPSNSSKRKRGRGSKPSGNKRPKRRSQQRPSGQASPWMQSLEIAQGPLAYANAAAAAVPNPQIGLRSLRNLHLFKSIYQRHHMIRQSWMQPETEPLHLAFRAHQRHVVTCLQFDSDKILTGSDDANIDIYDTRNGASLKRLEGHEGGVWALEYQDNILVSGSTDRSVRVWNMETGKCLQVFQGHTSTVRCLQILQPAKIGENADGSSIIMPRQPLIITGSRDSTCRVWRLPKIGDRSIFQAGPTANDSDNPYFVRSLTGHHHSVRAIAAHGDTLVSGSYDSTVRVWKISTGEMVHRLTGHTTKVYSVVLDHARGRCISGSMDNLVKVWSLETGQCLFNLEGHTSLVGLLDLKDDCLVSAAADATLRIWDPENGRCRHVLGAHTGAITCFAHDGQKVISGSERTLKMWNTQTGEFVRDLLTDLSGVWQIKFDDRRCVAAVQRNNWTYIEVLDFGAGAPRCQYHPRGKRIIVNSRGHEVHPDEVNGLEPEADSEVIELASDQ